MAKRWKVLAKISEKKDRLEEIVRVLLLNRGLKTKKSIEEFFDPPHPSSFIPKQLEISQKEMTKAIKRIKKAISSKEKVIVYSDYDADGICGAAILWETLHSLGARVLPYVPHREKEGYGLSKAGIDTLLTDPTYTKERVPTLIITIDHGVVGHKEVLYANEKGFDVIIIDHHEVAKTLPKAFAIVHTTKLCAGGLAWVFSRALDHKKDIQLELAALATIADLVPLTGANRSIVKHGLFAINKTTRPGLLAIIEEAGLTKGAIGTYEIGFIIAPRLNAMGRLVHAMDALRLLCTTDMGRARDLAQKLGMTNKERQQLTIDTTLHARTIFQGGLKSEIAGKKLIFLAHETYNQGVIGLVAGKLVEEYYRPAIVVSRGEIYSKASARSINGFNIIEAIRSASDILINCGGHPMAAGFTVETKHLSVLQKRLEDVAEKELSSETLTRTLKIDCEVELSDLNWDLYKRLRGFMPFGMANPEPVFTTKRVLVQELHTVGFEGKHLKLWVSDTDGQSFDAIGFGFGEMARPEISGTGHLHAGIPIDLAFTLSSNTWNGNQKLQLKIKDIKS